MLLPRFQASANRVVFLQAALFAFVLNLPIILKVFQLYQPIGTFHDYFIYTVPLFLLCACNLLFHLLMLPLAHKILMPVVLLIGVAISYNSLFFDVYFNRDMLDNVLQTTPAETMRMFSPSYIAWLFFLGIVPVFLYLRTKIEYRTWWKELLSRLASMLASVLVILLIAALFYQDYASFFRNHNSLKHMILPSNAIGAVASKIKQIRRENMPYLALGQGAQLAHSASEPNVTILVVGETTRAKNWGLNGYAHQTTPKLAERMAKGDALVNFPNVQSCGTATALSVPCMFSSLTRETYGEVRAKRQDNLLDILQTAGANIHWLENNSDCKGVCQNISSVADMVKLNLPEYCTDGECLDNIMLPELDKLLQNIKKDTVIVLHTIGNHGPTYFERYTDKERRFTPTCDTKEINRCSNEQLVNTYDNGVVYVDQFLDQLIARLEQHPEWRSSLLYMSDHGESLGENGIYLHGTPYAIAPKEQTSIPMIMWFSPAWLKHSSLDMACVRKNAGQPYSQDNFFHTALSLADVRHDSVKPYQAQLDILAACRTPNSSPK